MMTPSQLLAQRAQRMKNKLRQLLCERLESRYAMHAMPWGFDEFSFQASNDASYDDWEEKGRAVASQISGQHSLGLSYLDSSSKDEFHLGDDCLDITDGLFGEGEANDVVTGNLVPNGSRPWTITGLAEAENRSPLSSTNSSAPIRVANAVDTRALLDAIIEHVIESTSALANKANSTKSPVDSLVDRASLNTSNQGHALPGSMNNGSPAQAGGLLGFVPRTGLLGSSLSTTSLTSSAASTVAATAAGSSARSNALTGFNQTPDLSSLASQSATVSNASRTVSTSSAPSLLVQATTSYSNARSLGSDTSSAAGQMAWNGSMREHAPARAESDGAESVSAALRSVIEGLAQQRESQRQAAARHATETGWQDDLAVDALTRSRRDANHDDGLLALATLPERMARTESLEPYAAVEQAQANRLGMTLVQVGSIHEFELAGEHLGNVDLIVRPDKMLTETRQKAIAAIDAWHAEVEAPLDTAKTAIDGENSVLNRMLLPLSFLAMGGMLIASRRKYRRLNRPAPNRSA